MLATGQRRHVSCILALALAAALFVLPTPLLSQTTAPERAKDIVEGLTRRTSLPPLAEIAKLDAAPAEVCRALGEQLQSLKPEQFTRVTAAIADSTNHFAHASLLIGMVRGEEAFRKASLRALTTLDYADIQGLGPAAGQIMPKVFESLRESGAWQAAVTELVRDLCAQDQRDQDSESSAHRQMALALLVDLHGGENGFRALVGGLVTLMVGEAADDTVPADAAEPEAPGEKAPEKARDEATRIERERLRIMHARRRGALGMFRRLMVVDPDGQFQLGLSSGYELRVAKAKTFWDHYGGTKLEVVTEQQKELDTLRLINNEYIERFGPVTTWRDHLRWLNRQGSTRDDQAHALVLMDELVGGIEVEAEKAPPEPGTKPDPLEKPPIVKAFKGETVREKIDIYMALDARSGQRPRARAVRKAFDEKFPENR